MYFSYIVLSLAVKYLPRMLYQKIKGKNAVELRVELVRVPYIPTV